MKIDLTGKTALVCGASEGIGRATALQLAELGACVVAVARNSSRLDDLITSLPDCPLEGLSHRWVCADFDAPEESLADIDSALDGQIVNILINNAGGPPGGPLLIASDADFLTPMRRHLLMSQQLLQRVLPGMRESGYGRLINIISTSVREPIPGLGVSNTVRGAMASWAKTLSAELGPDQITVNNVLPGFTQTGRLDSIISSRAAASGQTEQAVADGMKAQVPFGRFAEAEELAQVIAFLASPAASYVSGQSIAVDGGRMKSI